MKNRKKITRAFTIVELVIVIAVIAILASVLVPTFSNIIKKANISKDTQLVRNLNTALATDKATNGEHITMQSALDAAYEAGYDVARINASATDNEILWDSVADVFCYLNDGVIEYTPDVTGEKANINQSWLFWQISSTPSSTYSTYLYNATETSFEVSTGIDVGNEVVTSIKYVNTTSTAKNVVIRTNSLDTTLIINDQSASGKIWHYGVAEYLNIIECATASYHEAGYIPAGEISTGRVVNEKGTIELTDDEGNTETKETGVNFLYINASENDFEEVIVGAADGASLPTLGRDDVSLTSGAIKVVEVQTITNESVTNANLIWLKGTGVYEDIVVTETTVTNVDSMSGNAPATTTSVGEAAYEIANQAKRNDTGQLVNEDNEVVTSANAVLETKADKEDIITGYQEFAGGTGTEEDPWLITNFAQMQKISNHYDEYHYYKIVEGTSIIDCTGWKSVYLNGSFDGSGVKFTNVTACLFQNVGYKLNNDTIVLKNFSAVMNISATQQYGACALVKNIFNAGTTTFNSVDVHGKLDGYWNIGSYYNYGPANYDDVGCDYTVNFINCKSDATLICTSGNTCGGFLGHGYEGSGHTQTLNVDSNSEYTGTIYTTGGNAGHYIAMNSTGRLVFNGVETSRYDSAFTSYDNNKKITIVAATKESDGYKVAVASNAAKVVVTVTGQLTAYESDNTTKIQNLSGITMTLGSKEYTNIDSNAIILNSISSAKININQSDYGYSIENGVLNVNVKGNTNYRSGTMRLTVSQYDVNGNIICCGTINLYEIK